MQDAALANVVKSEFVLVPEHPSFSDEARGVGFIAVQRLYHRLHFPDGDGSEHLQGVSVHAVCGHQGDLDSAALSGEDSTEYT